LVSEEAISKEASELVEVEEQEEEDPEEMIESKEHSEELHSNTVERDVDQVGNLKPSRIELG